jgi:prolyl oligopeptidase
MRRGVTRAGCSRKQHVFDDFIAAAEYLVQERPRRRRRLASDGSTAATLGAVEDSVDLFAIAPAAVGVMDMLRYRFTNGRNVYRYGSSESRRAYLGNTRRSTTSGRACYPATLVTTDLTTASCLTTRSSSRRDARAQDCDKPVLIRIETQGSLWLPITDKRIAGARKTRRAFVLANVGAARRLLRRVERIRSPIGNQRSARSLSS